MFLYSKHLLSYAVIFKHRLFHSILIVIMIKVQAHGHVRFVARLSTTLVGPLPVSHPGRTLWGIRNHLVHVPDDVRALEV